MASGPQVPDANKLSEAQTKSNIQTATAQTGLNAINQTGPGGSTTYKQIGTWPDGTPRFQQDTTLSPEMQGIYNTGLNTQQQIGNTAQGLAGGLGGSLQSLNQPQYGQYGQGPNLNTNPVGNFDQVRSDTLGALNSQLDQRSNRDEESLRQRLANQGIQQGTEAYRNAIGDFGQQRSSDRTNAILAANTAQGQAQDMALNSAGFGNQALQQQYSNQNTTTGLNNQNSSQGFQDQIAGNSQKINQLLSLLGGSQVQQPQASGTPQSSVSGTDVTGNAWNQFNAQTQQGNQFWSGLGSLGGTLGGWLFSDRNLKTDIHNTGMKTPGGVPVKDFRYKGSPMLMRGVMAQDVAKHGQSDAVAKTPSGFLAVDYKRVR